MTAAPEARLGHVQVRVPDVALSAGSTHEPPPLTVTLPCQLKVAVGDPVGKLSVITRFVASDGPPLLTVIVYLVSWPSATGSTLSTLLMTRSIAALVTAVVADALLLAEFDSAVVVAIVTSFWTETAPVTGRTTTVAVCCVALAIDAHVQVSVPPSVPTAGAEHVGAPAPTGVVARLRNAALAGSVSVIVTEAAVDGPLLRAAIT